LRRAAAATDHDASFLLRFYNVTLSQAVDEGAADAADELGHVVRLVEGPHHIVESCRRDATYAFVVSYVTAALFIITPAGRHHDV